MECMNKCGNEATGRGKYCSRKCKTAYNRHKPTQETDTQPVQTDTECVTYEQTDTKTETDTRQEFDEILATLPGGVSRPTSLPTDETAKLSTAQLQSSVNSYRETTWLNSPEYAEIIYRLATLTVEQLEEIGQFVPEWKDAA